MVQNTVPVRAGTVVALSRYPVKSMHGEALEAAELRWTWLHGDRQYAFVKASDTTAFPWLTGRDVPALVRYQARYLLPGDPRHSAVRVVDPDGVEHDIRDRGLTAKLTEAAGDQVWLMRLGRGAFDAMPISVITTTMHRAICAQHGSCVSLARFRANVVIRPDDPAVTEQDWIGRSLAFGDQSEPPRLSVDWPIPRCAMVGIDPVTADRDPRVVRTVVQHFGNKVGAYCTVQAPGTIRLGDRVGPA